MVVIPECIVVQVASVEAGWGVPVEQIVVVPVGIVVSEAVGISPVEMLLAGWGWSHCNVRPPVEVCSVEFCPVEFVPVELHNALSGPVEFCILVGSRHVAALGYYPSVG